jgi:hypothetical protein
MGRTWGSWFTGAILGLAVILCGLQMAVCFHTGRRGAGTALAAPDTRRLTLPLEPRATPEPSSATPKAPSTPREPGRHPLPRQLRGVVPEAGPRPSRRAVA